MNQSNDENVLRIDVDSVLKSRMKRHYRYLPKCLVRWLEKFIHQDEMNSFLERNHGKRDEDFCRALVTDLGVTVKFKGLEKLPPITNRRVLFVSNHPLGGLDGVALIDFVARHYGCSPLFVVNDILSAVEPLSGVFVPINKHGAQSRDAVKGVDEAFESDRPVIMFPAGLCSRRGRKGRVSDLEWQKMFVMKARQSGRDIIPLHFCGENSSFFYKFANIRKRLGIKFNIEMICLPGEMYKAAGKQFEVIVGDTIPVSEIDNGRPAKEVAASIRSLVCDKMARECTDSCRR